MGARIHPPGETLLATLRGLDDDALAELLRDRPDLAVPAPADLAALTSRALSTASLTRVLDGLDEFTLRVLDGLRLVATDNVSSVKLLIVVTPDLTGVADAVQRLRDLALVWGPDTALHFSERLPEASGMYPAGLGRPAAELDDDAAALVSDAAALRRTVLAAPQAARAVLDKLAEGPPVGTVTDAFADVPADTPVRWLIAHHLLVPIAQDAVELPREVGSLLRRDSGPLGGLRTRPPVTDGGELSAASVDSAGAGQALEAVRMTEALLEALADDPVSEVKAGGMGVAGLRRVARAADVDDGDAGVLLEAAYAAGLIGTDAGDFLPTNGFDTWRSAPVPRRWARLARAWLTSTRDAARVGGRDAKNRPVSPMSAEAEAPGAPARRHAALGIMAEAKPGGVVAPEIVCDVLAWQRPRRRDDDAVLAALRQAALLGVTARDALTGYGRQLLADDDTGDPLGIAAADTDPAVSMLDELLPPPVEHIVVQTDLTALVPGPPSSLLAAELALLADRESTTGYRISEASIRRAMDAGYAAEDIRRVFTERSRGDLPQALTYLIDDVARRHGGLRAGAAGCYLRSEDTALLAQATGDRRLSDLRLKSLAPTVLVSPVPLASVLAALRRHGYAPVAEDAGGSAVINRRLPRRATTVLRPSPVTVAKPTMEPTALRALVDDLRAADARSTRRDRPYLAAVPSQEGSYALLTEAAAKRVPVWVEYTDGHGGLHRRLLRPVSLRAGYLRAEDDRTEMLHTIAVHMIRSAEKAD